MPGHTTSEILHLILHLLPILLSQSLSAKSLCSRWYTIRSKLSRLQSSLTQISILPDNHLLEELLPELLATLYTIQSFIEPCCTPNPVSKLQLQSDLDIATCSLSLHTSDLDVLIKSGVLFNQAIVPSHPGCSASRDDIAFFVRDLFARLQIGGIEFKKKALDSLLKLLGDKHANIISEEGNVAYLIHLLDCSFPSSIREEAAEAVAILAASSEASRKILFEEGSLGPLLRLLDSSLSAVKERASMAIEAITADPDNAWAVAAYGGAPLLVEACRSGSRGTQSHACGAVKNVIGEDEVRRGMIEEGIVLVLLDLLPLPTTTNNAASSLSALASCNEEIRLLILEAGGLQRLLSCLHHLSAHTLESCLRAVFALSNSPRASKALSCSSQFHTLLAELISRGNRSVQHLSTLLINNLQLNDVVKRSFSGCIGVLVKLVELEKPVGIQEAAATSLVSLLLVRNNRKDLASDEANLMNLVHMLDPLNKSVCKKFPIMVVTALLAPGSGARRRLIASGAYSHIETLASMNMPGAKQLLQKLEGNPLRKIFSRNRRAASVLSNSPTLTKV